MKSSTIGSITEENQVWIRSGINGSENTLRTEVTCGVGRWFCAKEPRSLASRSSAVGWEAEERPSQRHGPEQRALNSVLHP